MMYARDDVFTPNTGVDLRCRAVHVPSKAKDVLGRHALASAVFCHIRDKGETIDETDSDHSNESRSRAKARGRRQNVDCW